MEAVGTILTWVVLVVWGLLAWYVVAFVVSDSIVGRLHQPMSLLVLFFWPLILAVTIVLIPFVVALIVLQAPRGSWRKHG